MQKYFKGLNLILSKCKENRNTIIVSVSKHFCSKAKPNLHAYRKEKKEPIFGKIILLAIPVSTLCLGVWQVYRWRWKVNLIDELQTKVAAETVEFPHKNLLDLENLEYKKVKVRGHFDYTKNEIILGPRSLLNSGSGAEGQAQGLISKANTTTGFHLITPFTISSSGLTILVNRGWIPASLKNKLENFRLEGETEIVGVVRNNEQRSPFMTKNIPQKGMWLYRDIPEIAEYLGVAPAFLDLHSVESGNILKGKLSPVPAQTRVTLRNEHVSYFTTWFSLSLITGYMWHRRFIRKLTLR